MIHVSQVGVRNVMIFAAYIGRVAQTGTEYLNAASKLGCEVEVSCVEHASVEIKKSTAGSEEWLDAAIVHPIHLRTDGTATSTKGILSSLRMPRVSDECHWNDVGNPANRDWAAYIDQPV